MPISMYYTIGAFIIIVAFAIVISRYKVDDEEIKRISRRLGGNNVDKAPVENSNSQSPQTSFDDFIAGRMSFAKCFWLYFMLIGFVLSFLCLYFAELYLQHWLYIFPVAYYALVTVAVWNCATLYTKDKLENKQPYGWAIATKIYVSFNAIVLASQIFTILSAK